MSILLDSTGGATSGTEMSRSGNCKGFYPKYVYICQMIEMCSVNGIDDFLRSQSNIIDTHFISHERLLNVHLWQIHQKILEFHLPLF